jgi:hypothetical protein
MRGQFDNEKILEAEIVRGRKSPNRYHQLSKGMDYMTINKQTEKAVEVDNMPAVHGLALSNPQAVNDALNSPQGYQMISRRAGSGDNTAPNLFFMLRGTMSEQAKPIFRRLARRSVIKVSQGILGRGLRGNIWIQTEYSPDADDFDDELTMENYMETGYLSYDNIIALEKREKQKSGVLIFDTSGSLFGERFTTAAIAVAVMAYHLAHDNYAVVLFNTKAYIIKRANERIDSNELVNRILDAESAGYTNISEALEISGIELNRMKGRNKFAILVSDGVFNKGGDPRKQLHRFPKLHILSLPSKHEWGQRLCRDMARKAKGRFAPVSSHEDVPRALMNLLRDT